MKYCAFNPERPCNSDCVAYTARYQKYEFYCERGQFPIETEDKESFEHYKYTTSVFKKGSSDET